MSRSYYHHPHLGIFLTAESKVLTRTSRSRPRSAHQSLLLPISLRHNAHFVPPNTILPQARTTWLAPSLPSSPMFVLWLCYVKQLILLFLNLYGIHHHLIYYLPPTTRKQAPWKHGLSFFFLFCSLLYLQCLKLLDTFYKYLLTEWINFLNCYRFIFVFYFS